MTEFQLGSVPVIGMLGITLGAFFYQWGGRQGKWRRRWLGSAILSTALWVQYLILGLFNWWLLAVYPLTVAGFSLGYGGTELSVKLIRRGLFAGASAFVGCGLAYLYGAWWIVPIEIVLGALTVFLGIKNPLPAAVEEFAICVLLWFPKMLYPYASL